MLFIDISNGKRKMKNDFEIIVHKFDSEICIVPIFDVHYGSPNFDEKAWKRTKDFILNNDDVFCVWGGDIIENQTKNTHDPFGNTVRPFEQKQWYKQQLKDLAHKTLCGTIGNHTARKDNVATDECIDYEAFDFAGIADLFRPNICFVKLQLGDRNECYRQTYMLEVTHSMGGGSMLGSNVNKQLKALNIFEGIDIVIVGHTHKPVNFPTSRIVLDSKNNKVTTKTIEIVVAPSYLKYGGYALRGQLQPAPYEDMVLKLTKRKNKKIVVSNDYDRK